MAVSDEDKSFGEEQAGRKNFNSSSDGPLAANTTQRPSLAITLMNLLTPILRGIRGTLSRLDADRST